MSVAAKGKRGRPGQPTKLTEKVLEYILAARRRSLSVLDAAKAAGVSAKTHYNWLEQGRQDDANGRNSLFRRYLHEVPLAQAAGKNRRLRFVESIAKNKKATAVDVHRGRLMLAVAQASDSSRQGWERIRLLKRELELRSPPPPAADTSTRPQAELQRLSAEDFTRYLALSERVRSSFASVTPAEFAELQELLRKAQPQDGAPEVDGGAPPERA